MTAEPRHHTPRNPDRPTLGHGPAAIARAKGRPQMPWQRDASDVLLELDPETGLPWYGIGVISTQRQSGKTTTEGDIADHRCLMIPRARVWFTMQSGKDAAAWMRDEHFPALAGARGVFGEQGTAACKYRLSKRAGAEGVEWPSTGSTFRAFAPTRDGLHSKQGDLVIVDEAWSFNAERGAELKQAIRPTMATRKGSQLLIVSTRGDASSAYLDEYVALALSGLEDLSSRVALIDYGLRPEDDPEDLDVVASRHPAYGYTIDRRTLEDARADFGSDTAGWARAYGNVGTVTREAVWPAAVWTENGIPRPLEIPGRVGLAFDVTPSGDEAAVVAAWRDEDGHPVVEPLALSRPPGRDLPDLLAALSEARGRVPVVFDPKSVACLEVADQLARDHPRVEARPVSTAEYAAACSSMIRGVFAREFHHFHDPDLDEQTANLTTRPILDGGVGFARRTSTGSIALPVAAALAVRAFDTLPKPRRKPVARSGARVNDR